MNRNVVLIVLDTVRKDIFDANAGQLQSMADIRYDSCRAVSGWSMPSHATLLTGRLPHQHGLNSFQASFSTLSSIETVFNDLPNHTALGVSSNIYASSVWAFDQLFDSFSGASRQAPFAGGIDLTHFTRTTEASGWKKYVAYLKQARQEGEMLYSIANGVADKLSIASEKWPVARPFDFGTTAGIRHGKNLLQENEEPVFLFMNFMEAHPPYRHVRGYDTALHGVDSRWSSDDIDDHKTLVDTDQLDELGDYLKKYRSLYAASVEYLDRKLTTFIKTVREKTERPTSFIITSDHGQYLGESTSYQPSTENTQHQSVGIVGGLGEELLHVPLIVIDSPAADKKTAKVKKFTSHLDLRKLVIQLAFEEVPEITKETIYGERIGWGLGRKIPNMSYWNRVRRCAYRDDVKIVWDHTGEAVRYRLDPTRPNSQSIAEAGIDVPDWARDGFENPIEECLDQIHSTNVPDRLDTYTRSQMEKLGYL